MLRALWTVAYLVPLLFEVASITARHAHERFEGSHGVVVGERQPLGLALADRYRRDGQRPQRPPPSSHCSGVAVLIESA